MRSGIFIYHNYIAKLQRSMVALASREALCGLLAAGCWLLAAGCWLLAAGCWLQHMLVASRKTCGWDIC
ncbi:hypothetical protein DEF97_003090 [Xanthomonas vasicola]|nr:hypothetical protein DEF96_002930 [Xanthomonas vasicola]RJN04898.1 hypothetical protein DEF97_003090 [Xanthomonas vasicola]RJN26074.1 hypothetical protein DEG04_002095 [Xanthomonas vasicola]